MQTGERQSARMRISYLQAMLSQDVGFFDTDCTTGEIVSRISSDTLLVQDAISEKVKKRNVRDKMDCRYVGEAGLHGNSPSYRITC